MKRPKKLILSGLLSLISSNLYSMERLVNLLSCCLTRTSQHQYLSPNEQLIKAAIGNRLDKVREAVAAKADINTQNESGWTALTHAAFNNNLEMVKYLVEHGADVNFKNKRGPTILGWAAYYGNQELVSYLIQHGADINAPGIKRSTPLTLAARYNRLGMVQCLLEYGAEVNLLCDYGHTVLTHTTNTKSLTMVKLVYYFMSSEMIEYSKKKICSTNPFVSPEIKAWLENPVYTQAELDSLKEIKVRRVMAMNAQKIPFKMLSRMKQPRDVRIIF